MRLCMWTAGWAWLAVAKKGYVPWTEVVLVMVTPATVDSSGRHHSQSIGAVTTVCELQGGPG